ncbi:MAG: F0F1 ATP synthase subunit epsilon, partial [Clostridiales Family XIII bacterium]|nr:F0F1 ATP synthase subunit epsilon [Clostridiales Family XIII bacterium]
MAKSFSLEIVTPEKLFYWGNVEIVIARTLSGEEGFMADHIWACKLLSIGELWFREAGGKDYKLVAVSGGFIDVKGDILVFTDAAEWPEEIEVDRANEAVRREEAWLEKHGASDDTPEDIELHKQAVRRAKNRLGVAGGGVRPR